MMQLKRKKERKNCEESNIVQWPDISVRIATIVVVESRKSILHIFINLQIAAQKSDIKVLFLYYLMLTQ